VVQSVLVQRVAVCCSVSPCMLQRIVAVYYSVCVAVHFGIVCCRLLQCIAVCVAVYGSACVCLIEGGKDAQDALSL